MNRRKFLKYLPLSLLGLIPATLLGKENVKSFPMGKKEVIKYLDREGYVGVQRETFEWMRKRLEWLYSNTGSARYINRDVVHWFDDDGKIVDKEIVSSTSDKEEEIYLPKGYVQYIIRDNPICKHIKERKIDSVNIIA